MVKKPVSFKVDEEVLKEFNKTAKANALNKSQWVENKMVEYVEINKKVK